jgi:metal-responsive CopG/Arc/MetJ family transcriptional regulator
MKIAISVPDELFADAERLARRMKKSRSELYSRAIAEYLGRHSADETTEAMNAALAAVGKDADAFATTASRSLLSRVDW